MKIIDVHSHWGTRRGYPLQTEAGARPAAGDLELGAALPHRGRDGGTTSATTACGPSSISASPSSGPLEEMRALHDYAFETERGPSRCHPRPLDPYRSAARRRRRRQASCGAASTSRIGFLGYRRLELAVAAGERPGYEPYYELCIEAGIPGADLRRHHRARRRPAGRRRRHPRPLPPAPPRPGRRDAIPSSRSSPRGRAGRGRRRPSPCSCTSATSGTSCTAGRRSTTRPTSSTRSRAGSRTASCSAADYPLFTYERLVQATGAPRATRTEVLDEGVPQQRASASSPGRRGGLTWTSSLKDKVAIVGGASMGIGYGIARTLAAEGARVAITARREPALAQAARDDPRRDRRRGAARPGRLPPGRGLRARRRHGGRAARRHRHPRQQRRRPAARRPC